MSCNGQVMIRHLGDADLPGAEFGPGKEPVFSTQGYWSQGTFEVVGVDRHLGVVQMKREGVAPVVRVAQGRREPVGRQQRAVLEPGLDPIEERLDMPLGVIEPNLAFTHRATEGSGSCLRRGRSRR